VLSRDKLAPVHPQMKGGDHATKARCEITVTHSVQVFQLVRDAGVGRLCGKNPDSGQSYEQRRGSDSQSLSFLASLFRHLTPDYTVLSKPHAFGSVTLRRGVRLDSENSNGTDSWPFSFGGKSWATHSIAKRRRVLLDENSPSFTPIGRKGGQCKKPRSN